jgi:hypothetical protein
MVIDSDGYIIGVIVAGLVGEDLNFAIPSASIRSVIDSLMHGEAVRRPWIGLSLREPDLGREGGVQVRDVFPSSPLVKGEIGRDTVIESINGTGVDSVETAQRLLSLLRPGNIVRLGVSDGNGFPSELLVIAASRPDFALYNGHRENDRIATLHPFFGFSIDDANPQPVRVMHDGGTTELTMYRVTAVEPESFVASRGVAVGDRIGFLEDEFFGMTREIVIFHLPAGQTIGDLHDIDDYIYIMRQGRYDRDIL